MALYWALDQGYQVETITFDYYRRSRKEIQACIGIAKFSSCANRKINLGFLKELDDSKKETKNPGLIAAQSAYIPSRNLIFYGIASSYAEIGDFRYIVGGHNKNDSRKFPDLSQSSFRLLDRACLQQVAKDRTGEVVLPFARLDKSEVLLMGAGFEAPRVNLEHATNPEKGHV